MPDKWRRTQNRFLKDKKKSFMADVSVLQGVFEKKRAKEGQGFGFCSSYGFLGNRNTRKMMFLWLMTPAEHERIRREGRGGQGGRARRSIGGVGATWAFKEAKG